MSAGWILFVAWLIVGAVAVGQRDYFSGSVGGCTKVSTIVVTILAGPLNYVGMDPKVNCKTPQPASSK
jgi:hypothetical protein